MIVSQDLFGSDSSFIRIPIPDADVQYLRDFLDDSDFLLRHFIAETPWRAEDIRVWGKTYAQPRLIAWYGDPGRAYSYSGIQLEPLPWTDALVRVKEKAEAMSGTRFNSVLLNYYRDNRDSMGFHSDDEKELGPRPVIASISLGETRTFVLKHKIAKELKPVRVPLESGTLLLMQGDTQKYWKHGIEKESAPCGPRVNLTFRTIE